MGHRVCPWWLGYLLASPLRRLLQDPAAVIKPYVRGGMTVLEPGPGMGFFTVEVARTDARLAPADSMGLQDLRGKVDFALAMAVVHEMPSSSRFFEEVAEAMKPGATLLLAEPSGHVKQDAFEAELQDAAAAGLEVIGRPAVPRSQAALLRKSGSQG